MKNINNILVFILTLLFCSSVISAELTLCNGVWTNNECSNKAKTTISEYKAENTASLKNADYKAKRDLVRDLQSLTFRARKELKFTIPTSSIVNFCFRKNTLLNQCAEQIKEKKNYIKDLLVSSFKNKKEETKKTVKTQALTTQVVNNRWPYRYSDYGRYFNDYGRGRYGVSTNVRGSFLGNRLQGSYSNRNNLSRNNTGREVSGNSNRTRVARPQTRTATESVPSVWR